MVGDFGLASVPGAEELTRSGKPLGPRYYIAPEMERNPAKAEAGPADVYSLCKTLWTLAKGKDYPLSGQLPETDDDRIVDENHPALGKALNGLIYEGTTRRPERRPNMSQLADRLMRMIEF